MVLSSFEFILSYINAIYTLNIKRPNFKMMYSYGVLGFWGFGVKLW